MALVTTGLTNGGVTTHYRFSYDEALAGSGGPEPARTNAVITACEADYNLMSGWFGGGLTVTGMSVQVTTQSNGASWNGTPTSSTIQLKPQGAGYSNNPAYLRYLLVAEVTEIFMMTQNLGWFQSGDEGSKGEGLSRFLSSQFLVANGFLGAGIDADYAVANLWLNSSRQDFVNNAPDDNGYNATNGCTTLFIYYLFHQFGYTINEIVAAAGATLTAVYRSLTGDPNDPFPTFKRMLDTRFPSSTGSSVPGPNFDDPWPLGDVAWSGVWRSGNRPYYLWIHAGQSEFVSKWQTLAAQNMRLTDIDVSTVNGSQLWSGIWEDGTDGYYLWYDADQTHFLAKWSELAAQNLRLVSIKNYNGLYAGVWRSGTDGYYIWVDADDAHFLAKWSDLAAQNLRLVDFDVATVNGQRRWCGVWRSGSDGYYLWINADWQHFQAKWSELAAQGFRLTGLRYYDGLWAGIWRSGTDAYYLWADANESVFLAKWGALAAQGLRLVDVIATPFGGASETEAALSVGSARAEIPVGKSALAVSGRSLPAGVHHGQSVEAGAAPAPRTGDQPASAGEGRGGGSMTAANDEPARSTSEGQPDATRAGEGGGKAEPLTVAGRGATGTTAPGGNPQPEGAGGGTADEVSQSADAPSGVGTGGGSLAPDLRFAAAARQATGEGGGSALEADETAPREDADRAGQGGGVAMAGSARDIESVGSGVHIGAGSGG